MYHQHKGGGRGKGRDKSAVRGSVHDEEYRAENRALGTPQDEVWKEERLLSHLTRKEGDDK